MKHVLFKNKAEHWAWCHENYFRYYGDFNPSPWSKEDEKIMKPFFDWQKDVSNSKQMVSVSMPDNVKKAFEHYDKVRDKGMDARDRIDVTHRIDEGNLLDAFGFYRKYESDFETSEEYEEYCASDEEPELGIELSYPCVMVCSLIASWDRIGDVTEVVVDYVELKEFKEVL